MPSAGSGMAAPYMPDPLSNYDETGNRTAPPQYSREEMNAATLANRQADPNWIRGKTFDAMTAMGADPGQASLLSAPFAFAPGIGDAQDAEDAGRAYASGDYLTGGLMTAMAIAPFASAQGVRLLKKGMNEAGEEVVQKGIKAYHGSPHDFDAFDINKIGTGEGAQAYGHGLYFAESEGVAKSYRDALQDWSGLAQRLSSEKGIDIAREDAGEIVHIASLVRNGEIDAKAGAKLVNWRSPALRKMSSDDLENVVQKVADRQNAGNMYEVNINANPDDFLDWDKQFAGQSQKVRDWLDARGISEGFAGQQSGAELFQAERRALGDEALAQNMKGSGLAGVKYLDHGSRFNAMDGIGQKTNTRNYVVFDDKLISIVKKYGIVGAVAAGLLTKEQGDALAAQMQDETAMQKEAN